MRLLIRRCYSCITLENHGPVQVIEINRPLVRNAVDKATARKLFNAFNEFDKDDSVKVGILAGKGGNFCAGYDLNELARHKDMLLPPFSMSTPAPMVSSL